MVSQMVLTIVYYHNKDKSFLIKSLLLYLKNHVISDFSLVPIQCASTFCSSAHQVLYEIVRMRVVIELLQVWLKRSLDIIHLVKDMCLPLGLFFFVPV